MIKCYSVRVKSIEEISPKAVKVECFDGSSDILPKSQIFGFDEDVSKSDAIWVSAWILEKKNIQYSKKKEAHFNEKTGKMMPTYTVHTPDKVNPIDNNEIDELKK